MSVILDIAAGIIGRTCRDGGEAPSAVRIGPQGQADLLADLAPLAPPGFGRHPLGQTIMSVPIIVDPMVPERLAYIVGVDPAHTQGATAVAMLTNGVITAITITNAGRGYTGVGVFSRVDAETAQASKLRARGLLKSLLTVEQWAEFEAAGAVTERIDGCEFKLRPGGMIEAHKPRLLMPAVSERWCVYPDPYADKNDYMPEEDKLIGQLLHLRAGPDKVRAMANVFKTAVNGS